MGRKMEISDIVECTRQEILFAIKERITEVTRNTGMPVQLKKAVISGGGAPGPDSVRYYEVNNVYLDECGRLCGDLAGRGERLGHEILFGRDLEDLGIEDMKLILDSLYAGTSRAERVAAEAPSQPGRRNMLGFFSARRHGVSTSNRRIAGA